jgi:hypothetical protein
MVNEMKTYELVMITIKIMRVEVVQVDIVHALRTVHTWCTSEK